MRDRAAGRGLGQPDLLRRDAQGDRFARRARTPARPSRPIPTWRRTVLASRCRPPRSNNPMPPRPVEQETSHRPSGLKEATVVAICLAVAARQDPLQPAARQVPDVDPHVIPATGRRPPAVGADGDRDHARARRGGQRPCSLAGGVGVARCPPARRGSWSFRAWPASGHRGASLL